MRCIKGTQAWVLDVVEQQKINLIRHGRLMLRFSWFSGCGADGSGSSLRELKVGLLQHGYVVKQLLQMGHHKFGLGRVFVGNLRWV